MQEHCCFQFSTRSARLVSLQNVAYNLRRVQQYSRMLLSPGQIQQCGTKRTARFRMPRRLEGLNPRNTARTATRLATAQYRHWVIGMGLLLKKQAKITVNYRASLLLVSD